MIKYLCLSCYNHSHNKLHRDMKFAFLFPCKLSLIFALCTFSVMFWLITLFKVTRSHSKLLWNQKYFIYILNSITKLFTPCHKMVPSSTKSPNYYYWRTAQRPLVWIAKDLHMYTVKQKITDSRCRPTWQGVFGYQPQLRCHFLHQALVHVLGKKHKCSNCNIYAIYIYTYTQALVCYTYWERNTRVITVISMPYIYTHTHRHWYATHTGKETQE